MLVYLNSVEIIIDFFKILKVLCNSCINAPFYNLTVFESTYSEMKF